MIAQCKQDLYNKSFSHQDQNKRDDGLQKRKNKWPNYVVNKGGPIPENVYDYDHNDLGLAYFSRGAKYDPGLRELEKFLKINDSENY